MKQKFTWMVWVCAVCLWTFAACTDHEPECNICDEQPDGPGVWLSFDFNDEQQTRSTLQSSEVNYKDVKEVYLYIFEGNTADAKCILAEKVGWKSNITQKHWISADLKEGVEHTFLAVGCDRKQEINSTYGFPDIIEKGSKLGDCMAKVQQGMTQNDIAHEQFFVGTLSKTVTNAVEDVALTLRRKVAGILVYLRNIPVKVVLDGRDQPVEKLQVRLHTNQNTQLPLWKSNPKVEVFGNTPLDNSDILFNVDLKNAGFTANGEYYTKDGNDSILAGSYLAGAYLLPIAKTANQATLSVDLIGTYTNNTGTITENHILKTYEVRYTPKDAQEGTAAVTDFDIKENTLYAIGKKLSNSTTSGDKPADLSGNLLELEILPWDTVHLNNVFPTVIAPTSIEADFNDDKYIFNSWNDSLIITIKPAVDKNPGNKKPWMLKVNYEPGNKEYQEKPTDWIHFETYDELGKFAAWTNEVNGDGTKEVKIKVMINDYAVRRNLPADNIYTEADIAKFKNDIREATLEVYTYDGGVGESKKPYTLRIRQYNTLTVYSRGDKHGKGAAYRGISRLDFGCEYDKQLGEVIVSNSAMIDWGYFTTGNAYVSGDNPMDYKDGEVTSDHCYERMMKGAWGSHAYKGSAIQRLTRRFIHLKTVDMNGKKEVVDMNEVDPEKHEREKNWYLPAFYEMWGVSLTFGANYEAFGHKLDQAYWTSSGDNGWYKDAYIAKIGVEQANMQRDKNNSYHAMYMVHFDEKQ